MINNCINSYIYLLNQSFTSGVAERNDAINRSFVEKFAILPKFQFYKFINIFQPGSYFIDYTISRFTC